MVKQIKQQKADDSRFAQLLDRKGGLEEGQVALGSGELGEGDQVVARKTIHLYNPEMDVIRTIQTQAMLQFAIVLNESQAIRYAIRGNKGLALDRALVRDIQDMDNRRKKG